MLCTLKLSEPGKTRENDCAYIASSVLGICVVVLMDFGAIRAPLRNIMIEDRYATVGEGDEKFQMTVFRELGDGQHQ